MFSDLGGWHLLIIVVYLAFFVLGAYLLYTVVRLAVRKALRQHQEWLDARPSRNGPTPVE